MTRTGISCGLGHWVCSDRRSDSGWLCGALINLSGKTGDITRFLGTDAGAKTQRGEDAQASARETMVCRDTCHAQPPLCPAASLCREQTVLFPLLFSHHLPHVETLKTPVSKLGEWELKLPIEGTEEKRSKRLLILLMVPSGEGEEP